MSIKPHCRLCEEGFPLRHGKHWPASSLGMIAVTPCCRERFHFRGFVVQPIGEDGESGFQKVRLLDGSDRVLEAREHELFLVNDYSALDDAKL